MIWGTTVRFTTTSLRQIGLVSVVFFQGMARVAGLPAIEAQLAGNGQALLPVVISENASPAIETLAGTLAEYLERISGATFAVERGDGTTGIALGAVADFPALAMDDLFDADDIARRDQYLLRTHDQGLYIIGALDLAAQHGVWDFLYRLGHRQFFPTDSWEIVPEKEDLSVALNVFESPDFYNRSGPRGAPWSDDARWRRWQDRNRMTSAFTLRTGHSYDGIISRNQQAFDENPEYLALVDGVRGGGIGNKFCIANAGLRQLVVEDAINRIGPADDSLSMDPSDGGSWCECGECAAMGSVSDRVIILCSAVADAINALGFDAEKYVGTYAYASHSPPPDVFAHSNVIVSIATAFIRGGYTLDELIEGWSERAAMIGIREYHDVHTWSQAMPRSARGGNVNYLAEKIPYFHEHGARFMNSEASDSWGANGLGYYLSARWLWNVNAAATWETLVADFLHKAFGEARDPMREFYHLIAEDHKTLRTSEDILARMYDTLDEAYRRSDDPAVRVRLDELTLYTRYVELRYEFGAASTEATRLEAAQNLYRHAYRMRHTMMVHVPALYRWLRRSNVEVPEAANYPRLTVGDEGEDVESWKSSEPFTAEEIAAFLENGLAQYERLIMPFRPVFFSDDLAPAADALNLPEVTTGDFGLNNSFRGRHRMFTWFTPENRSLTLGVTAGLIYQDRGNVDIELYSPLEETLEPVDVNNSVPPDGETYEIVLTSPYDGLHALTWSDGQDLTRFEFPAGHPMTVRSSLDDPASLRGNRRLYFYVPEGTRTVGGYTTHERTRIYDGGGNMVMDWGAVEGGEGYFNIPVPEGRDGALWEFRNTYGSQMLITVPPYLARNERELLLPREVVTETYVWGEDASSQARESVPSFSGATSYIHIGTPDALQIPDNAPLTVEGWIYLNLIGSHDLLYSKSHARRGGPCDYLFGIEQGFMAAYDGTWRYPDPAGNAVETGRWHHVAYRFDGDTLEYYLNGQLVGTNRHFRFSNHADHSVKLGGYGNPATGDIAGMKSDVRVWDHARSPAQIAQYRDYRLTGSEAGLLGYWPLNAGVGGEVRDGSTNRNAGLLVNAAWTVADNFELRSSDDTFRVALPLILSDIQTGIPGYTTGNEVDVAAFSIAEGYNRYQFTGQDGGITAIDPYAWRPTDTFPERLSFEAPEPGGDITEIAFHVWLTNANEHVTLQRARGVVLHTAGPLEYVPIFLREESYIDLGTPDDLQIPDNSPLTVEGWMRFDDFDGRQHLYSKNNPSRGSTYTYMFGINDNNTMSAYTGHGAGTDWREVALPSPLQSGRWYHLAFSFDGANMTYYLDGDPAGTQPFSFGNFPEHSVTLGGYSDITDVGGTTSEIRVWNHARSGEQIRTHMNYRLTGMEGGLLAYWPLNEGTGLRVSDGAGNDITGTVFNAGWRVATDFNLPRWDDTFPFILAAPFTLANRVTGSRRFTDRNTVDLVAFPVPSGYTEFQFSASEDAGVLDPQAWLPSATVPDRIEFTQPGQDTNIVYYAWFTNTAAEVVLQRAQAAIYYTTNTPVPALRATLARERIPGQPVVIYASDIDVGSTGGGADGRVMDIHDRAVVCPADPTCDRTPNEPYVTLASEGVYPLGLWLQNEAGNTKLSTVSCEVTIHSYRGSNVWTGVGKTDLWHDSANWSAGVPQAGQVVVVGHGGEVRLTDATAALAAFTLDAGATLTVEGWNSVLHAGAITIAGTMTHLAQSATEPDPATGEWVPDHRILLVGTDLNVTDTGVLNADYVGYGPAAGQGGVIRGGGYGHGGGGGYGGRGSSGFDAQMYGQPYGVPSDPWQPGSGGGRLDSTGNGIAGGAIRIEMSGRVTVDGLLTARGQNGLSTHRTAASGGGIAIDCETFQGAASGLIRVDGGRGNYYGGSGAGGRIAVHYDPTAQAALANPRPPVRFSAHGWPTSSRGDHWTVKTEMGTLYFPDLTLLAESPTSAAVLDGQRFWHTRLYIGDTFSRWSPQSLVISNCVVAFPEGFKLDVVTDLILAGTQPPLAGPDMARAGLHLHAAQTNALYGARLRVGRDWTLGSNTWFYPHGHWYSGAIVGVRVGRHVTLAAGGGIDADEKGYMPQPGNANAPGAGPNHDSGGSYGGKGGGSSAAIREAYGMAALPLEPGSPGGWRARSNFTSSGKGGGAIHVIAGGNLRIDGLLSANGGRGWYYRGPGGSGGSIFLSGWRVHGSGILQATGGAGEGGRGPGGGGRIAVWRHIPLNVVEQRIATRDVSRIFFIDGFAPFAGSLETGVSPSVLTYQPQEGSKGFYTIDGTMIILR